MYLQEYNYAYLQCLLLPLLKRMQLSCTAWVESLKTSEDGREKHRDHVKKYAPLSLHDLSTGRRLLGVAFVTSVKLNSCTPLTIQKPEE